MRYHRFFRAPAPLRAAAVLTLALAASWTGACVPVSVAPFVAEEDAIELPGLVGAWLTENGDTMRVTALGSGEYEVDLPEKLPFGSRVTHARYVARAGRLGSATVLDVRPLLDADSATGLSDTMVGMSIPGHILFLLEQQGDSLRLRGAEGDSLAAALGSGVLATPALEVDDLWIMTAPTDSLRAAFLRYMERPGAMGDWSDWLRRIR